MHEMGIACSILEAVQKVVETEPGPHAARRASKVAVRIGEFAGVDVESLRFCFEVMARESSAGALALDIEWCRAADGRRGDELELAYVEIEEAGADPEGAPDDSAAEKRPAAQEDQVKEMTA
jgi:hypothetical protein